MAVEQPERDPREIENALMPIKEAFEQSVEAGIAAAKAQLRELTRGEDTDPELAAIIAEKLDLTPYDIPENLQNTWETTLGEAFMYGGKEGNDFLGRAAEKYTQVTARARERLPEDLESIPDGEKPDELGEYFHANDRQFDIAILRGDFEAGRSAALLAVESRGKFASQEAGPVACATYAEGAALFMQGKVNEALECIEQARNLLKEKQGESTLIGNINNLETAAMALDELDPDVQDERRVEMTALLKQYGGERGGIKRIDFNQLFTEAEQETENLEA